MARTIKNKTNAAITINERKCYGQDGAEINSATIEIVLPGGAIIEVSVTECETTSASVAVSAEKFGGLTRYFMVHGDQGITDMI